MAPLAGALRGRPAIAVDRERSDRSPDAPPKHACERGQGEEHVVIEIKELNKENIARVA
jgi:hypothetical protein